MDADLDIREVLRLVVDAIESGHDKLNIETIAREAQGRSAALPPAFDEAYRHRRCVAWTWSQPHGNA